MSLFRGTLQLDEYLPDIRIVVCKRKQPVVHLDILYLRFNTDLAGFGDALWCLDTGIPGIFRYLYTVLCKQQKQCGDMATLRFDDVCEGTYVSEMLNDIFIGGTCFILIVDRFDKNIFYCI